ncbi:MAG: YggS family pyridoxal phosphate-dependent enzyme [Actinomycetota bacterium]|nr:MAG: pyridoxal phosphate enzyme YggS [Actinomycetota bacterium]MDO8949639.1 YggS family pyridoxal phosphate-dependent enzyme [Actinomycetota bacterium]MDP3630846.1 YggS family pyridoxal phosphate-dependent enzyme [Actinomycetota bacterium]
MSAIAERYAAARRAVHDAADAAGRSPDDITIVAVTKHVGIVEVRQAISAGCVDFGENRVQEFLGKYGLFPDVNWHFIGTLQTNKVKDVVGRARLIHSVDSLRLLEHIDRVAETHGVVQDVLLQVNVSGESSKHGMTAEEAEETLRASLELPAVNVSGLMTIAPYARPEDVRWVFRDTARLFASLAAMRFNGIEMCELSMGMTNDYYVAIEEGATIIRVGQAIFGR